MTLDSYRRAMSEQPVLQRFRDPTALLDHLHARGGDLDDKDVIYTALVELARTGGDEAKTATAVLWLGLWPGLDAIYRRRLRGFPGGADALVSEITAHFTQTIHSTALHEGGRLAATLVGNTKRDVGRAKIRSDKDAARHAALADDDELCAPARGPEAQRCPLIPDLPRGLDSDAEVAWLRERIAALMGREADLVLGVAVDGYDLREAAELLGIGYEATRKRFARAIRRLRDNLEESSDGLSQIGPEGGVSLLNRESARRGGRQ